jgi:hypothetical protein
MVIKLAYSTRVADFHVLPRAALHENMKQGWGNTDHSLLQTATFNQRKFIAYTNSTNEIRLNH